jgi:hypothetical protein
MSGERGSLAGRRYPRALVPRADRVGDVGRQAVYAAELAAFDGTDLECLVPIDELRAIAETIVGGGWWRGPGVEVRPARVDSRTSTTRCLAAGAAQVVVISLAGPQATLATLVHELAHALAGPIEGHGPRFRRALLDVVVVATSLRSTDRRGCLHHDQLAAAMADFGLAIGERWWPAPPAASFGPIAL